jgi:prepilin-type N-terminal cleavage/methylation domain-containing protein
MHRKECRMSRSGFSLFEMMVVMAIMALVMGVLVALSLSIGRTASAQRARIRAAEEARSAMQTLASRVRLASAASVNMDIPLPGDVLTFNSAADLDGNGTAVDVNGRLELGPTITVQPDTTDLNGDGRTATQLVMVQGTTVRVLCNSLPPDSAVKTNGVPLVRGFWVAWLNGGVSITIQTEAKDNRGQAYHVSLTELVVPRNAGI